MSDPMTPQADSGSVEGLKAALERIAANETQVWDQDEDRFVCVSMTSEEMAQIAADALGSEGVVTPPPPVEGGWRPDPVAVARIIDPGAWDNADRYRTGRHSSFCPDPERAEATAKAATAGSLAKADAILALPSGWRPIENDAPSASHVLATRFSEADGEWLVAVVMSPPIYPFTHWMPLPSPPEATR